MRRSLLTAWLAELRNPASRQAREALCDATGARCCLGVLLDVEGIETKTLHPGCCRYEYGFGAVSILPIDAMNRLRFRSRNGDDVEYDTSLAKLNDDGMSFAEIADLIEAYPERFFKVEEDDARATGASQ